MNIGATATAAMPATMNSIAITHRFAPAETFSPCFGWRFVSYWPGCGHNWLNIRTEPPAFPLHNKRKNTRCQEQPKYDHAKIGAETYIHPVARALPGLSESFNDPA